MDNTPHFPHSAPDFNVALATSLVMLSFDGSALQVLLARSDAPPFEGNLFLPSRYVSSQEDATDAAYRVFAQMFGRQDPDVLEQLQAFAGASRHPGGRVVNIAHYALVRKDLFNAHHYTQHDLSWHPLANLPELAFDHNAIVEYAMERLKRRVKRRPVGFNILPEEFTINQLQNLYEQAMNKQFDRRNFRKKLAKSNVLIDLHKQADGSQPGQRKSGQLYSFNKAQYALMMKKGYDFVF